MLNLVEMSIRYSNGDAEAEAVCNCPERKDVVPAGARYSGINVQMVLKALRQEGS